MAGELKETREGKTSLLVPAQSLSGKVPATFPVFFNPAARLNRDISVAVAAVTKPATYLDALAGTGARGVRVANEVPGETLVTLADFNEASVAVARENARINGVAPRCEVVHEEANRFLYSRFERQEKFEAIDVDPFGSPAPYLQGTALASADGATLSFTATDAAVLCGVYPKVARRRYSAATVRSEFVHETALRILIGFAARAGGVNDIGVEPVVVHSTLHYLRVFVRVGRGPARADESTRQLGYVTQCEGCGVRHSTPAQLPACPGCSARVRSAGPLWTGSIVDAKVLAASTRVSEKTGLKDAALTLESLKGVEEFPPFSYSLERACSKLHRASVSAEKVIEALRRKGFRSMVGPFDELTLKTSAGYREFFESVREASGSSA